MGSCLTQIDLGVRRLKKLGGCTMSHEFDRLHRIEKAAVESVLNRSVVSRIFRTFGWLSGTRPWLTR